MTCLYCGGKMIFIKKDLDGNINYMCLNCRKTIIIQEKDFSEVVISLKKIINFMDGLEDTSDYEESWYSLRNHLSSLLISGDD